VIVKLTVTPGDAQAEAAALTGWAQSLLSGSTMRRPNKMNLTRSPA
jgi:hypothetical protein